MSKKKKKKSFSRSRKEEPFLREASTDNDNGESSEKKGWFQSLFSDDEIDDEAGGENDNDKKEKEESEKPEFLNAVRDSIINLDSYIKFKDMKTSTAFGFIGLVLLIVVLISVLNFSLTITKIIDNMADFYKANIPVITIKDGKAKIDGNIEMPFETVYKNPWKNSTIILDTTGAIKDLKGRDEGVLVTETKAFVKFKGQETMTIPFSELKEEEMIIDEHFIRNHKKEFFSNSFPILVVLLFLFRSFTLLIQLLIFAGIATFICKYAKIQLNFRQLLNLSIYAAVPALVILMLLDVTGVFRVLGNMISTPAVMMLSLGFYYLIFIIYLYGGVSRIRVHFQRDPGEMEESN